MSSLAAPGSSISKARADLQAFLSESPHWLAIDSDCERDYQRLFRMLKKYPDLAKEQFEHMYRVFPLAFMMAAKAPLEIIQQVYQMYPDGILKPDSEGYLPLHDAVFYKTSFDVINFLVAGNTSALSKRTKDGDLPIDLLMRTKNSMQVEHFTEKFQLLYNGFPPHRWENAGKWVKTLSKLMNKFQCPRQLLAWLAKKQTNYLSSTLRIEASIMETWINNIKHFIPLLECQNLELDCSSCSIIPQLFSMVSIPPTLAIKISNTFSSLPADFDLLIQDWGSCQLQDLTITNFTMPITHRKQFVLGFQVLPNLKKLHLQQCGCYHTFTDSVIDLLEGAKLDQLFVSGGSFVINVKMLSLYLQKSKSTTFVGYSVTASLHDEEEHNYEIAYHSSMNRHGRAKIIEPNATKELLFNCLCSVEKGCLYQGPSKLEESLWYGLLRTSPGLWACTQNSGSGKKRPADNLGSLESKSKKMKCEDDECAGYTFALPLGLY